MQEVLSVENLTKTYKSGSKELTVLNDINFSIAQGESLAIVGSSGSGKTTLLGLCAGLDTPSLGSVSLYGKKLGSLSEDERAALRNEYVGFIFQNFQLVPTLTALENVMIPLELNGKPHPAKTAKELLARVGLGDRYDHYPSQLSGGEQQRVSLARAFSNAPKLLFADEPTGNLDDDTSGSIEDLLFELNRENGTTLIIVTHDNELAAKTNRIIRLKGGHSISDTQNVKTAQ
ncbi:MAG: ABC transporter ATP-binding protein [Saprospiraceae bacterium]